MSIYEILIYEYYIYVYIWVFSQTELLKWTCFNTGHVYLKILYIFPTRMPPTRVMSMTNLANMWKCPFSHRLAQKRYSQWFPFLPRWSAGNCTSLEFAYPCYEGSYSTYFFIFHMFIGYLYFFCALLVHVLHPFFHWIVYHLKNQFVYILKKVCVYKIDVNPLLYRLPICQYYSWSILWILLYFLVSFFIQQF